MVAALTGIATIAAYLVAVRAYGKRYPQRGFSVLRILSFVCGTALMTAAVLPPIDAAVDASFAAHMVQHLVLTLVGPPLLLLGAPLLLLVSLPSPRTGRAVSRIARHPVALALLSPVLGWLLFIGALWSVHFTALYELALRNEAAHVAEHLLLIATAILFWMPVVQVGYAPRPLPFPTRMLYLFLAIPPGAFLGLTIFSTRYVLYAHYEIGRTPAQALADQQNAGALMWIAGGAVLFTAFMATAAMWAARERDDIVAPHCFRAPPPG
ncbi:MAG: cytochrome c oxidase assembly protein [Candidatus Eremiobacteraeota bacterium]|nr:cytochrome c oxidase assembly protein [Candidatus Eremiobacteraeota bacterium]